MLVHLLNRFNVKKVNFSSVRFLKSMENNSIRNVKFKKWILLLLRIGIISALVLMLSRPVTRGFIPGWLSTERPGWQNVDREERRIDSLSSGWHRPGSCVPRIC